MKISFFAIAGLVLHSAIPDAMAGKTIVPEKIDPALIGELPYSYNGVVLTDGFRGSGFCAWNEKTFFTAAHMVFDLGEWTAPPAWYPKTNAVQVDETGGILSRGYYRWISYADLVADEGDNQAEFGRDMVLAYSFKPVTTGKPAKVNVNGSADLQKKGQKWMITGYPAENFYTGKPIKGYFLHSTGLVDIPFKKDAGKSLHLTLVTTGGGNSGGPVWTKEGKDKWTAGGILVGGLPSETTICPFSSDVNSMFRAVSPVLGKQIGYENVSGIDSTSTFSSIYTKKVIPDGVPKWTSIRLGVHKFGEGRKVKSFKISTSIETNHQGDLIVVLEGPGGAGALLHKEEGGPKNNLVLKDVDLTEYFTGLEADGDYYLRIQDRLKGDIATFKSMVLEIAVDDATVVPPTP